MTSLTFHKTALIGLLALLPLNAQVTSPPGLERLEGTGSTTDLFSTATFRFQQIDASPAVIGFGSFRQVAFRGDGFTYEERGGRARSYEIEITMGGADYASLPTSGTAFFAATIRSGRTVVFPRANVSLPDMRQRTGTSPEPPIPIPFPSPYRHVTTDALVIDIRGTNTTATGNYWLDAEQSYVAGRGPPPGGCHLSGIGQDMSLTSSITASLTGCSWMMQGNGNPGAPMGLIVGDGDAPSGFPPNPCEDLFPSGNVSFLFAGMANGSGQFLTSARLPCGINWGRQTIFLQTVTSDLTQPYGIALSNGIAQTFPENIASAPQVTQIFAPDVSQAAGNVRSGEGVVLEYQ